MTCIEKAQKYQWNITYERDMENFFPITFEDSGMTELEFEKYLDERLEKSDCCVSHIKATVTTTDEVTGEKKTIGTIFIREIESPVFTLRELGEVAEQHGDSNLSHIIYAMNYEGKNFTSCNNAVLHTKMQRVFDESNLFVVDNIYVEPEYRNKGIGTELVKKVSDIIRFSIREDYAVIALVVPCDNGVLETKSTLKKKEREIVKFYKECGFEFIGHQTFLHLMCGLPIEIRI